MKKLIKEGQDFGYKGNKPGFYDEKGNWSPLAKDFPKDELQKLEAEYIRRRGKSAIEADLKRHEAEKAKQEKARQGAQGAQGAQGSARAGAQGAQGQTPPAPPTRQPDPPRQPEPPTRQPDPPRQPAPQPARQESPVAKYMTAAAAARKSGDPAEMAKVRDMGMEIWRKSNPKLAAAADERERIRGTAQSDNPLLDKMGLRSGMRAGSPTVQSPTLEKDLGNLAPNYTRLTQNPNAGISPTPKPTTTYGGATGVKPVPGGTSVAGAVKPVSGAPSQDAKVSVAPASSETNKVGDALSANRLPKEKDKPVKKEAYDIVLDYLFSEGHVDTLSEAHYVMMQMDAEHIQSIVLEQPQMSPIFQNPAAKYKYGLEARTAAAADFFKKGIKPEPKLPSLVYNTDGGPVNRSPLAKSKPAAVFKFGDPKTDEFAAARQFTQPAKPFRRGDPETDEFAAARRNTVVAKPKPAAVPPKPVAAPVKSEKPATPAPAPTPAAPAPKLSKMQQDILDLRQMRSNSLNRQGDIAGAQKLQTEIDMARVNNKMAATSPTPDAKPASSEVLKRFNKASADYSS